MSKLDDDNDRLEKVMDTDEFKFGYSLGRSYGHYELESEAIKAYDMGEIDLWVDYHRSRTREEWEEFHRTHDKDVEKRWKKD